MRVSVCGCGWLGLPLAKHFVHCGYETYGTSRSLVKVNQLIDAGIHGVELSLPLSNSDDEKCLEQQQHMELLAADFLVINVPPGRGENTDTEFINKIKSLSNAARTQGCKRVIFISTTSVYGSVQGPVTESSVPEPNTASGKAHWLLEQWLREQWGESLVILRLAGLIGPNRHPVKFLSGRKALANGADPVNLIHLDDCIQVISRIITCWPSQKLLHLAAPTHPSRQVYYTKMARLVALPIPEFVPETLAFGKEINAEQTLAVLGVTLLYPDLMIMRPELG